MEATSNIIHNTICCVFHHFANAKFIETFISLWHILKEVVRNYSLVSGVPCIAEIHHKLLCLADSAEVFPCTQHKLPHQFLYPKSSPLLMLSTMDRSSENIWKGSLAGATRQFTKLLRWIINIVFPLPPIGKIICDPEKLNPRMHQPCEARIVRMVVKPPENIKLWS